MATEEIEISELELAEELAPDNLIPIESLTDTKATTLQKIKEWLGLFFVDKTSDEEITGGKTFKRTVSLNYDGAAVVFKNPIIEKGTPPISGSIVPMRLIVRDKNNIQLGVVDSIYFSSGESEVRLICNEPNSSGSTYFQVGYRNGKPKVSMAQNVVDSMGANDNSTAVCPTSWVQKYCKETNKIVVEANQTGDSWYRKYSDGWIEQGGRVPVGIGQVTVNLVKPMKNGNYSLICTANFSSATAISYIDRYATNFKAIRSANTIFTWEARGYGK